MKKRKLYKRKPVRIPKIVCAHNDFDQIDRLLLMIENENVLSDNNDVVMVAPEGIVYQVAPALSTWCDYWKSIADLHGMEINDVPLRNLINKINYNMYITKSMINEAKEVVEIQRRLFMGTDHNTISRKAIELQMTL